MKKKCYNGSLYILLAILLAYSHHALSQNNAALTGIAKPYYKYRKDKSPGRELIIYLKNARFQDDVSVTAECEGKKETMRFRINKAVDSLAVLLSPGIGITKDCLAKVSVVVNGNQYSCMVPVPRRKQWTVYIYPHSHVDVGYTNLQDVVEKIHVRNVDVGIDIARKTKDYPAGARFVWNTESTWVVANYLKHASLHQKKSFIEAVRKGWIQVDGAHSNLNMSTCSDEQLMRMFKNSTEIAKTTGVPISTMVQVDLPGGTWGVVQAAAQNGIKGFLSFPNWYDMRSVWDHRPFYWLSPDRKHRIFFLQGSPYGYGYQAKGSKYGLAKTQTFSTEYDRVSTNKPLDNFIDPFIFEETARLEMFNSPYDIYAMTWSMADNCVIDADLPEAVKQWNEIYAYPRLVIAGSKTIMDAFEKKYGAVIPEYTGDFSEYWNDGLCSDARRVGIVRKGREDLVQAEILWPLINKNTNAPIARFDSAWENALLAAEHTWGYQNPKAPVAKQVEANKAAFFENTEKISRTLINEALAPAKKNGTSTFAVINTLGWERKGLVTLTAEQSKEGNRVLDEDNNEVLTQRLTTGELVFETGMLPSLGSKLYRVVSGSSTENYAMNAKGNTISNGVISLTVSQENGAIETLTDLRTGHQFADTNRRFSLNSFHYVPGSFNGRDTVGKETRATDVSVKIKENGPLIVSLIVQAKGEGCNWLQREIKLVKGQPFIELTNSLDKTPDVKKEAIHFAFAFSIPGGVTRMDMPLAIMRPETDQLRGANRNWLSVQRWVDISNDSCGITWNAVETPIIEPGDITGTILDGARQSWLWRRYIPQNQTIVSWVTNNHWETNFPLQQSGIITSHYNILLHNGYDAVVANRFGMEQMRPLIVVETDRNPLGKAPVEINNPLVVISTLKKSDDNKDLILRLRSISDRTETAFLTWPAEKPSAVHYCGPGEQPLQKNADSIEIQPYGIVTLRISFNKKLRSN